MVLAPPLHVGHPQASVPHPGKRGRKQQLIRAHLLTQARERNGYGSHNWNVWGVPVAAEAGVNLQEPEAHHAFSQGSWPWIIRPSALADWTGSQEGVGSDLHLHTGPLVAAAAASGVQDNSHSSHSCRCCSAVCERVEQEAPMVGRPSNTLQQRSPTSPAGPGFFPDSLPASCGVIVPPGCPHTANPSPLPGV